MESKTVIIILTVTVIIILSGCSRQSGLVKECTELCFESGGKISQYLRDKCESGCTDIEYYGGETRIKATIENFKIQIQFKQNLESGVYENDITQCVSYKIALINAQNDHYKFDRNFDEVNQKKINLDHETQTCREKVENWVITENKQKPLGTEFKEEAESIKTQEEKVTKKCYPIIFEYKTLVYTKRKELKQHEIEKETISECLLKVNSPDFDEYIKTIEQDIPNWK